MQKETLTVIDLFAGAGGLSQGFELADFNVAAHIEFDRWACETLRKNFCSHVIENDIAKVDPAELVESIGNVDIIIGGPPCQGFSIVGKSKLRSLGRHRSDPRNRLYKQFVRFVYTIRPKAFVMENVPGILRHDSGKTAQKIIKHFEALGYSVTFHKLVAAHYGVPQTRQRVFFVGIRAGGDFEMPRQILPAVTAGDALSDLPHLRAGQGTEQMMYNKPAKTVYQRMMRGRSSFVFNHVARSYSKKDLRIFSLMKQGMKYYQIPNRLKRYRDDSFKDKYRRIVSSKPSWTVVAHLQKDGYMYIHPRQDRTITVREAARLQSFPDKFVFCGPMTQQFKQVGNAVPPLMAKAVALSLKAALQNHRKIELAPLIQIR